MAHIIPVRMPLGSRTLWFDANGISASKGNAVIVQTARGTEYGYVADMPFEATEEQLAELKSPLKPVKRLATEKDTEKFEQLQQRAIEVMPGYREIVEEEGLDMRPISVEFLFDGDKAVFYFEADDRVDFRELVRKLAARFKVRVDMRQIGPRDEARMIGGVGHCGQELCCKRLGGEFCPVSIRMAKEQDLSLNPQKISGICGRLMCCLRYEYDAYKDFKGRAPKMGAKIETPEGDGKVISLDVPKEIVTIQVGEDKKISVPLADMKKSKKDTPRPDVVDEEAWERAANKEELAILGGATLLTSQFTSTDKLGEAKAVHREQPAKKEKKAGRKAGRKADRAQARSDEHKKAESSSRAASAISQRLKQTSSSTRVHDAEKEAGAAGTVQHRRRRSTKLAAGSQTTTHDSQSTQVSAENQAMRPGRRSSGLRQLENSAQSSVHTRTGERSGERSGEQQHSGEKQRSGEQQRSSSGNRQRSNERPNANERPRSNEHTRGGNRSSASDSQRTGEHSRHRRVSISTNSPNGNSGKKETTQNAKAAQPAKSGATETQKGSGNQHATHRRPRRRKPTGAGNNAGGAGSAGGTGSSGGNQNASGSHSGNGWQNSSHSGNGGQNSSHVN